jgi:hypothetical protein
MAPTGSTGTLLAVRLAVRRCCPALAAGPAPSGRLRFDLDVGELLDEEMGRPGDRQTA